MCGAMWLRPLTTCKAKSGAATLNAKLSQISPASFETEIRQELLLKKLMDALSAGLYVSDEEIQRAYREQVERAKIRYLQLPRARFAAEAEAQAGWPRPGFAWVTRRLQEVIDESTIVVNEYPIDRRHLAFDRPGAFFGQPHSSGLGWALPAALGIKLGAPDRTVIAALGDGAYLFNEPVACHLAARQQGLPVLTVIYNNQQWEAVKQSTLAVHPDGHAQASGRFPLTSLGPAPRYEEIVRAFDGHGERVETPAEVGPALRRALAAVREGRQAVVNVLCGRARD